MIINGMNFTIGADPEFFIGKDGVPKSAYGLIKGDKKNPLKVPNGAVQVDGMAMEFNIDPAEDKETFLNNLTSVKQILMDMIPEYHIIDATKILFDKDYIKTQPRKALELGCEPDYNSRTGWSNKPPNPGTTMRTAGGHVHIGWGKDFNIREQLHSARCRQLTNYMDEEVGVYSILWDDDVQRRSMYGKASTYRPKSYGVEYRTMSNKWIFNPKLVEIVYDFTIDAIKRMFKNDDFNNIVPSIINNSQKNSKFFKNNPKADRVLEAIGG